MFLKLHLGNNQSRRVGISRAHQHIHTFANEPAKDPVATNSTEAAMKRSSREPKSVSATLDLEDGDADITRPPDDSSDSGTADIQATKWGKSTPKSKDKTFANAAKKKEKATINSTSLKDGNGRYTGTANLRSSRSNAALPSSASSIASTSSSKRKSLHVQERGAGMVDDFGRVNTKKAKKTFGSSSQRSASSEKTLGQKSKLNKGVPTPKIPESSIPSSPTSDSPPRRQFKSYGLGGLDSPPRSTPKSAKKFKGVSVTPLEEVKEEKPKFRPIDFSDLEDPPSSQPSTNGGSFVSHLKAEDEEAAEHPPTTQNRTFQVHDLGLDLDLDDALRERLADAVGDSLKNPRRNFTMDDEEFLTMTQAGRCPMCNAPVDPADIREFGKYMNIRMQEKFCLSHRMKTAKEDWEDKEYPTINWEKLDRRISKHHAMIKKLIKGEESYYRSRMKERIDAGKDRSFKTMGTNLIPGYYGARGLRAISENVMHKFTPLLKKRMVEDELMSARGYTAYVQSVLVPEITSRLIMDDMKVDLEKAREILDESAEVGELLNEEVRDVVTRKAINDSEDDEDEDQY